MEKKNYLLLYLMELVKLVECILKAQKNSFKPIPADITIENGNITLRSFRIFEIDKVKSIIKGLTILEEYIYPRENRAPEYCILSLDDIKEFACPQLDIYYQKK